MARARSPNRDKAYDLWIKSDKKRLLKDIAKELGVSQEQVRKWKNQDKWDLVTLPKETKAKSKDKGNVTKRKAGAPKGNKNAVGHGAPKGNKNNFKHGLYERIYWDTLTEEEQQLIQSMPFEEELLLQEQIALMTVRERRLMKAIEKMKSSQGLELSNVTKRKLFVTESCEMDRNEDETVTKTVSSMEVVQKLESELTKIQAKKTRCIEALNKLHNEKIKLEDDNNGNELVDDWINAVMVGEEDG